MNIWKKLFYGVTYKKINKQDKYMEKKIYGMKPSYKLMKSLLNEYGSFWYHSTNLVYYVIKHDYTEEQAIEYFKKSIDKCEKMLKHHSNGIIFNIPYELMKDVLNVSLDDFKLQEFRHFTCNYDHKNNLCNYDISHINISFQYRYYYPDNKKQPLFRDYNDHTVYLYNKCMHRGYYDHRISFRKEYDDKGNDDKIMVNYIEHYNSAGSNASEISLKKHKEEFVNMCISFWHFMKLLDCSENPNDIDIKELYKRKDKVDKLYDHTEREMETYKWEQEYKKKLNIK